MRFPTTRFLIWTAIVCGGFAAPVAARAQSFVNFESGQVRPLALSSDGSRLYAVNTPDNRLEIFDVSAAVPVRLDAVSVGLEPVAVALRSDVEAWVLNHLSDSVSIVDLSATPPRVVRTLLVGDEPRDIVFAGPGGSRAFITTAHRGQNIGFDPRLGNQGVGRADVWVFDANALGSSLGGEPIEVLSLFGDTPSGLATDGNTVWAGIFHSGNQTTTILEESVCDGGEAAPPCTIAGVTMPGGVPGPNMSALGVPAPETGILLKYNPTNDHWEDVLGRDWSGAVNFDLPDYDVFAIDAHANPPVETARWASVGTILFNLAVNPVSGEVYVTNTEARNDLRFEGFGVAFGNDTLNGHLHEARITVLDGAQVKPRHLNKHIDYDVVPSPAGVKDHSLATPLGMEVSADGTTLYVAAFGSGKVGRFDAASLSADTFAPDASTHVTVSGGGPTGLALDEADRRLFVLTRFDNSISVIDIDAWVETSHVPLGFNPEPPEVTDGRRFLYDADFSSSNGEASCAGCHVFGNFDSLAWNLGDPDGDVLNNPLTFRVPPIGISKDFHPLKGPMTTQTLRGMKNHGSMHWRGDRTGGNDPDSDAFDSFRAFEKFDGAFEGLLGRASPIDSDDMAAFAAFALSIMPPPNPIRALDNTLGVRAQRGRDLYFGRVTDIFSNCNGCHTLDEDAGFFGADGLGSFDGDPEMFKVAQLRNMYEKLGNFGVSPIGNVALPHIGPQIRGFGYRHNGSVGSLFLFVSGAVFSLTINERIDMELFLLAFPADFAPIVGQQATLGASSGADAEARVDLLEARQDAGECEVVVKGTVDGESRGGFRLLDGTYRFDRLHDVRTSAEVRGLANVAGQELTFTCVPPGSGERIGVDRDLDGAYDTYERDRGTDPSDPTSFPTAVEIPVRSSKLRLRDPDPMSPSKRKLSFKSVPRAGSDSGVRVPAVGGLSDPTLHGAVLKIFPPGGAPSDVVTLALSATRWELRGSAEKPQFRYSGSVFSGPVRKVVLKEGRLVVNGKGSGLPDLSGAPHGEMAVLLELGLEEVLCAVAPARAPAGVHDLPTRFLGEKDADAPAGCPPEPQ